jgi:hypothetical protein
MTDVRSEQEIIDAEHLRLLRIGYFISAGMTGIFALMGLLYAIIGFFLGVLSGHLPSRPDRLPSPPPPELVGLLFGLVGLGITAVFVPLALLKLRVAKCLRQRKSLGFCTVIAVISCLGIPYGTVLGVFTLIVLGRDSVKRMFAGGSPADRLLKP